MSEAASIPSRNVSYGTVVYRRATPADIGGMVELGLEALERTGYPNMVISRNRVFSTVRECVSGPSNIALVAERDGEIVAAVGGLVHPLMCYERSQLSIVQFYSRVRGAGVPLIRMVLRWAKSRPIIKAVVFVLETRADPRIGLLLNRLGLTMELPVYMRIQS